MRDLPEDLLMARIKLPTLQKFLYHIEMFLAEMTATYGQHSSRPAHHVRRFRSGSRKGQRKPVVIVAEADDGWNALTPQGRRNYGHSGRTEALTRRQVCLLVGDWSVVDQRVSNEDQMFLSQETDPVFMQKRFCIGNGLHVIRKVFRHIRELMYQYALGLVQHTACLGSGIQQWVFGPPCWEHTYLHACSDCPAIMSDDCSVQVGRASCPPFLGKKDACPLIPAPNIVRNRL